MLYDKNTSDHHCNHFPVVFKYCSCIFEQSFSNFYLFRLGRSYEINKQLISVPHLHGFLCQDEEKIEL